MDDMDSPLGVFVLAAILFNGGQIILEVFHLNGQGILSNSFSVSTTVRTIFLVLMGLGSFHLGALFSTFVIRNRSSNVTTALAKDDILSAMRMTGWVLFAISFPLWIVEKSAQIAIVLSGGYGALYQQTLDTNLASAPIILAGLMIPSVILITISSRASSPSLLLATGVILINVTIEFFLGYRAYAVWPLIAFAWAYHNMVRPIPRSVLLGASSLIFFLIFPLVGVVRVEAGRDRLSLEYLWNSYFGIENPLVSIVSEMGNSMRTISYTLDLVPSIRPYDNGMGYFYALTTAMPNVFGELHPAKAHGSAADWLINTVAPWAAEQGGGFGYSFIAEAYFNFGWFGSMVALSGIGLLMAAFFRWSTRDTEPLKMASAAIMLSFLTHFARGETVSIVRPFFWYTLIPCLLVFLIATLKASGRVEPHRGSTLTNHQRSHDVPSQQAQVHQIAQRRPT